MGQLRDDAVKIQYLIFETFSIIKKRADSIFRRHGLTGAQVGTLTRLSEQEGKPMHKLSEELWCDVSNITGVVARLEKQNMIWRISHPNDRRVSLIGITSTGKEALAETLPEHERVLKERIGKLSPEERETLIKLLTKLID